MSKLFHPEGWLDRAFLIGIVLKGLDGVAELVGGIGLLLVGADQINRVVVILTRGELAEDPHDFIARHLIVAAQHFTGHSLLFVAVYLLIHGIIKVILVLALIRDQLWAYPWMIVALIAFIGYQAYQIAIGPSAGLILLTVFDIAVVLLTWREYRHRTQRRPTKQPGRPAADGTSEESR